MQTPNPENLRQVEAMFRADLEDVIKIIEKISPSCKSFDELLDILRLSTLNDGQLRLIMEAVRN